LSRLIEDSLLTGCRHHYHHHHHCHQHFPHHHPRHHHLSLDMGEKHTLEKHLLLRISAHRQDALNVQKQELLVSRQMKPDKSTMSPVLLRCSCHHHSFPRPIELKTEEFFRRPIPSPPPPFSHIGANWFTEPVGV
jgi:hypothetical protein